MKEIVIKSHPYIPSGQIWCSYDAYQHIKKILKVPDEVEIPLENNLGESDADSGN